MSDRVFVHSQCIQVLLGLFVGRGQLQDGFLVPWVVFQSFFVLLDGIDVIQLVGVNRSEVEVGVRAVRLELEGEAVSADGLVELACAMVGKAQVEECWVVHLVY